MKTFLIDWGAGVNGARYALIQAIGKVEAFWNADAIGGPFSICELVIPKDAEGIRYLEIVAPELPYCGPLLSECFQMEHSSECLAEVYKAKEQP